MISDKQFDDAFTAAGGWFVAMYYELVADWKGSKDDLIDRIYQDGTDAKRTGTSTRVSSLMRIIDNQRGHEALEKVKESSRIAKQNPEAVKTAIRIIAERF